MFLLQLHSSSRVWKLILLAELARTICLGMIGYRRDRCVRVDGAPRGKSAEPVVTVTQGICNMYVGKSTVHRSGPTPLTAQMYSDRLVCCREYPLASLYLTLSAPIIHLDSANQLLSVIISSSWYSCSTRHVGISGHQSCRDA
jgi:hypothetical protein